MYFGLTPRQAISLAQICTMAQPICLSIAGMQKVGSIFITITLPSGSSTTPASTPCRGPTMTDGSFLPRWG